MCSTANFLEVLAIRAFEELLGVDMVAIGNERRPGAWNALLQLGRSGRRGEPFACRGEVEVSVDGFGLDLKGPSLSGGLRQ
jgi:hypothetical protein